ncbi:MAG: glycoside hydrolase, partial [Planctomycetaceae bacterium]
RPWNPRSATFQFHAGRTAMNWSMDWNWSAKHIREQQLSDRLQMFFGSQGMSDYKSHFKLDGTLVGGGHSTRLLAMNATASLAATHERAKQFVEALWDTSIPSGRYRYYDGMLYLLGMLNCSGQFRIWSPQ